MEIKLTERLKRMTIFKDRAPTPEELVKVLDVADLRGKMIVSMMALGGFREGTLARLQYRHVREDLEANRTPVHIHVESELTKGKYHDYDSFIGGEAVECLRLYMDQRREGTLAVESQVSPEDLKDNSPLLRTEKSAEPKSVTPKQMRTIVHTLYVKAGLLKKPNGRMYELRAHSLRKFFKTRMEAAGVKTDYIEYFMGHTVDTYNDIQSLGIEKLWNIYAAANLEIRPKTIASKMKAVKEMIRAYGMDPDQILTREALAEGATSYLDPEARQTHQLQVYYRELRTLIHQDMQQQTRQYKRT